VNLTEKPKNVVWPETHYVYVEKKGSFDKTAPASWGKLHASVPAISEHNKVTGYLALYQVEAGIYRAGVSLAAPPKKLPKALKYVKFKGGKYSRFVLRGPYSDLPDACGRVFEIVAEKGMRMRKDFCIEHYVTDPNVTPAEKTVTEILVPVS
jgi:effector-binding domain-containing protein